MDHPASPPAPPGAPTANPRERRSTADYRWTEPKVLAFLHALAKSGRVADAARAVGMSRNSAYRLRARLASARFDAAVEGARRTGIRARAAASAARAADRSRWEGIGIAEMARRERAFALAAQGDTAPAQSDGPPRHGDMRAPQGDGLAPQGDAAPAQGDAIARKVTKDSPEPCNIRSMSFLPAQSAGILG